jgi:hypothetical protein
MKPPDENWQTVTVDSKPSESGVHLIAAPRRGEILYIAKDREIWEIKQSAGESKVRVIVLPNVKGALTGGTVLETSALLIYQQVDPKLGFVSAATTAAIVDLRNASARTLDISHVFGPVKGAHPGQDLGHLIIGIKLGQNGRSLALLSMTWRGTLGQSEYKLDVIDLKKAISDFETAWKERAIVWRTGLPLVNEATPLDFTWDSKDMYYLLMKPSQDAMFVIPYASSRDAKERRPMPNVKSAKLINVEGKACVGGFSDDGQKFLVFKTGGERLFELKLPMIERKLSYGGCVGDALVLASPKQDKTSIFWRRLKSDK